MRRHGLRARRAVVTRTLQGDPHSQRRAARQAKETPGPSKGGDLAAIIDFAVTQTLERLEARRFAKTAAPRKKLPQTDQAPASRYIPAVVRREVCKRDQDRCRFVDEMGRRCTERHRLEFHHRHPFGMGGDHSPGNLSLMCAAHNRFLAECDYGQAAIRRHRIEKAAPGPPAS